MILENLVTKENLKVAGKVVASLAVGVTVATILQKTGVTEWMAEKENLNQTFGTGFLKDYAIPVGIFIYNTTAGLMSAGVTYISLNKHSK